MNLTELTLRCQQGWVPLGLERGVPSLLLPASGSCQHTLACGCITPASALRSQCLLFCL